MTATLEPTPVFGNTVGVGVVATTETTGTTGPVGGVIGVLTAASQTLLPPCKEPIMIAGFLY